MITIPVYVHNFWFENIAGSNGCCPNRYFYVSSSDMKGALDLISLLDHALIFSIVCSLLCSLRRSPQQALQPLQAEVQVHFDGNHLEEICSTGGLDEGCASRTASVRYFPVNIRATADPLW